MQPVVQSLLARELPRFVANICKIFKSCVRRRRAAVRAIRRARWQPLSITEALAALLRIFEERPHLLHIETAERRAFFFAEQK